MPDPTLDPTFDDQQLLAQVIDYYCRTFQETTEAQNYLNKRGITNPAVIERFRAGYANRSLYRLLPPSQSKPGRAIRVRLEAIGVIRSSGQENFAGCVTFPIPAADGTQRIADLYGRKTGGYKLRRGTPMHMHLKEQRKGVWNIEGLAATQEVILCSSLFDALTFWSHGYQHVTCMFGLDGLTEEHLAVFRKLQIERVLTPCQAVADRLMAVGLDCFLLRFPDGLDANTYALEVSDPANALGGILRRAEWLGKGMPTTRPTTPLSEAQPVPTVPTVPDNAAVIAAPPPPAETTPVRIASPLPPPPQDIDAEINDEADEVVMTFGDRRYRIRGLAKNLSSNLLKVNVLASNENGMFVDTFDLYTAKYRRSFVVQAAEELGVDEQIVKKDLGRVLLKLEELQDEQIRKALEPKAPVPTMTDEEREAALELLRDPGLLDRIAADIDVVGERVNKIVGYLAAVSRKLDQPLAVIVQSTSAAGKTALMEAVLELLPPEDVVKYSAMTGQALYYFGQTSLQHKVLAIVEEAGAERAAYALKLLQSERELRIASTGKEASTGRLTTQEYRVEGPVQIFLTTTSVSVDEELLNRAVVLTVDENQEQTRAIHQAQRRRRTLEGRLATQAREQTLAAHRNAQRLLRPLLVVNPHAEQLTFLDDKTRSRRDHLKYLGLIESVTLLHQYQRQIKTVEHQGRQVEYVEVTLDDIAVANKLAAEVLGRSLDELPPQTRRLLHLIDSMVTAICETKGIDRADYRFSRREVREHTGWGQTQLQLHLRRLVEMEYLAVHRSGHGRSLVYELLYEAPANNDGCLHARLIDVERLRRNGMFDGNLSGSNGQLSG